MDAFPADLTWSAVQAIMQAKKDEQAAKQSALLAAERKRVYHQIKRDAAALCEHSTVELPDALDAEAKRQLAAELCARFPGRVSYRRVVHYADVDEFVLIQDGASPPASYDYRVHLQ